MSDRDKYSLLERGLHRVALGNDMVARSSFDAEQAYLLRRYGALPKPEHPVFVAGLARAGTTLLMRLLYETGCFGSLTYRDMPFLMAPNLWSMLSRYFAKTAVTEERAHGDGLMVDFDSPEALEEVFWRVMCAGDYIGEACLKPMQADADVVASFRQYIAAVMLRYPGKRYLSKNNNNILRLGSLRRAFPDAAILVPFRNPLAQARSLMQQDAHFRTMHAQDAFAQRYMTWLAHYEFGAGHRPFVWGAETGYDRETLDYWLTQWVGAYDYLLSVSTEPGLYLVFVGYEDLCQHPERLWTSLGRHLGFEMSFPSTMQIKPVRETVVQHVDSDLKARALGLFAGLQEVSQRSLVLAKD